jgi:subtilisin family serine protease
MAGAAPIWPTAADAFPPDARALWSGTSFAAPQVAGAIAKIAMDDGVTPTEAKRRLLVGAKETAIRQASRDPAADLRT